MVRLSKRTYKHRLEVLTPDMYNIGQLARLNRDLDHLYEMLYSQWRTVTENDYKEFGGVFKLLLETIKGLYDSCRLAPKSLGLGDEVTKLGLNYSALSEINNDILNFGINATKNEDLKTALARAGRLMQSI